MSLSTEPSLAPWEAGVGEQDRLSEGAAVTLGEHPVVAARSDGGVKQAILRGAGVSHEEDAGPRLRGPWGRSCLFQHPTSHRRVAAPGCHVPPQATVLCGSPWEQPAGWFGAGCVGHGLVPMCPHTGAECCELRAGRVLAGPTQMPASPGGCSGAPGMAGGRAAAGPGSPAVPPPSPTWSFSPSRQGCSSPAGGLRPRLKHTYWPGPPGLAARP